MKKTLLATSALALIAATAGAVDVEMYGQVNKAVVGYNDGKDTDVVIVDNAMSSTRMGLKGAQALDNGLTASALFEMDMVDNSSSGFAQQANGVNHTNASTPGNVAGAFSSRQARVGLSGNFGGVYVGKQSVATDGVTGIDLTGAQDVMTSDIGKIGGGLKFRTTAAGNGFVDADATTGGAQDLTIGGMTSSFADERQNSIRYDSPIFAGFQGRGSIQQGGDMDLAGFYDGAMGDFKVSGAAGMQLNNDANTANTNALESTMGASVSVAHATGLAGTLAYVAENLDKKTAGTKEGEGWYAKVGYAWDAFEVAADYSINEHFRSRTFNKDELSSYGLAAQYNLGHGVSVAGLYRTFDADAANNTTAASKLNTESVDLYGVNMRVKF